MKAPETKFTKYEEEVIVGWAIYRDLAMQSSTTDKFREYVSLFNNRMTILTYFSLCPFHVFLSLFHQFFD